MASPTILLPSDEVPPHLLLKSGKSTPLRLGPGLRLLSHQSPSTTTPTSSPTTHVIAASQGGLLSTDPKRNVVSILSFPRRRYIPTQNDIVIAQIHHSSADYFHCIVTPQAAPALLPQLAFEGATKKTKPMLRSGDLVYARVSSVGLGAGAEIELTCVNPATGKAEPGGLGPLTGGMLYDVSTGMAARLLEANSWSNKNDEEDDENGGPAELVILTELGKQLESIGGFEVAIGRNGRVWVDCSNAAEATVRATVAIGRCIRETEEHNLTPGDQRKLVTRILREVKIVS